MQLVNKSRKKHKCHKCGRTIYVGDSYYRNGDIAYCLSCFRGTKKKQATKKTTAKSDSSNAKLSPIAYKICSIIARVLAILIVIIFGLPFMPIGLIITGVIAFIIWKVADEWSLIAKNGKKINDVINEENVVEVQTTFTTMPDVSNNKIKEPTVKKSDYKFPLLMEDKILKYSYYDVFAQGTKYMNLDFSKLNVGKTVSLVEEPNNEYDPNAIKIIFNNESIGYIPKNNLQSMLKDYLSNENRTIISFISKIDYANQQIDIAIGFYDQCSEEELEKYEHIDATLINTSKKDEYGNSRQESLEMLSIDDSVNIESQYDSDLCLVTDDYGNELGELNAKISEKLHDIEDEYKFDAIVFNVDETSSGKTSVKIRIYLTKEN